MCAHCGCNGPGEAMHDHGRLGHNHDHGATGIKERRHRDLSVDLLEKNAQYAKGNRTFFKDKRILALNIISSPGSGKTSLLVSTLNRLKSKIEQLVIEGDQRTELDAQRIRATGTYAYQIQTGKGCHLDAHLISHALEEIPLREEQLLWIENVGNLICPSLFDLGETKRVLLLSVAEGEDKPAKYPEAFYGADLLILTKIDLLPYVDFSMERCEDYLRKIRPGIEILALSSKTGEGMENWFCWIEREFEKFTHKPLL